ncbi:serine-rich coiled-coil domain-containing protein 2 [Myxocyprinus asiaticus]|uniref:serine-rich coiled-coil domain-containing protein 2 n=1 Tax=Myxocyprinus asiaticus TaxID=70543 RepID=UPI0022231F94|nr:serine-rich coiled-coil domain-containing protein 2 [Myxocyprinus asiaticus]
MERKAGKQLNMVSRLPKFTSRSSATTTNPLHQGSALPVSSLGCKGSPQGRHTILTRVPSLKWRKGEEDSGNKVQHSDSLEEETSVAICPPVVKKPSPTDAVKLKSVVPIAQSSSPRTISQPSKTYPRMTALKRLSAGHALYNGTATLKASGVNGRCGSGLSGSGLEYSSQQRSLESTLSLSNDSLKSASKENIVRSLSLTHFKRVASPTNLPMTRSFSFNKASELAKELPKPLAQSPVARSPLIKPNPLLSEGKVSKYGIASPSVTTSSGPLPKGTIKKSLLPSFLGNKPSALSYRLTRPSLIKCPPLVVAETVQNEAELNRKVKDPTQVAETSSEATSNAESAGTTPDETPSEAKEVDHGLGPSLEVLENMSLSSTSSLEHNDTSEEYIDDFDNLGNGGEILLLPVHQDGLDHIGLCEDDNALIAECSESSPVTSLHSFLSETVDWSGMGLTAGKDGFEHETLAAVGDFHHGSSLDLSPSVSSGGTYMWDEEGLEALGGSGHLCGSYDSDLNSMDILSNLENVESCDLGDDDLIMDLDLSEDASLHSNTDGMLSYECSETGGQLNQRRTRLQRWGLHDQFRCENRSGGLQTFDGCQGQGSQRSRSDLVRLDELTLKHMAEDCSSVKLQLLQLQALLQMEADGSAEDTSEAPDTPESTDQSLLNQKVTLLLKEVEDLRTELGSKDRMITELSQQLCSPVEVLQCHCQQRSEGHRGSEEHLDKSTQTPWRAHNPQILQAPRFLPSKLLNPKSLSRSTPTEAPCDNVDAQPGHRPLTPQSCSTDMQSPITVESSPNCTVPTVPIPADSITASLSRTLQNSDPDELSLTSSDLSISETAYTTASCSLGLRLERGSQKLPLGRSRLSTLQPPSFTKRASTLINPEEVHRVSMLSGALKRLGTSGPSRIRRQPLPAHGLPCISPAHQATIPTTTVALIYNPQNEGVRQSPPHTEMEISLPRTSAHLQPNHSRLPKAKRTQQD